MSTNMSLSYDCDDLTGPDGNSLPNSEEIIQVTDDQPLDFSRKKKGMKKEVSDSTNGREPTTLTPMANLTTPSSPPERVLCKLLRGNLLASSFEKLRNASPSLSPPVAETFAGIGRSRTPILSPTSPVMQAASRNGGSVVNDRINCSRNSLQMSPIGMEQSHEATNPSPENQADGVDHFAASGGSMLTAGEFMSSDPHKNIKYIRPFKAYQREPILPVNYFYGNSMPLQLPLSPEAIATQSLIATTSDQQYIQFREQMLSQRRNQESKRKPVQNSSANQPSSNSQGSVKSNSPNSPDSFDTASNNSNGLEAGQSNSRLNDDTSRMSNGGSSPRAEVNGKRSTTSQNAQGTTTRKRGKPLPDSEKDEAYWERRRKNNEAAKRSRDARRAKEDEIAIRAAFLEQENMRLRVEVAHQKGEIAKLRCIVYNNHIS
ncbi:protein giant-like protein [Dinothrombium tinctorium]|uniref:Protein giant-like protein n=1 Tax=Dinothrombium tinctorium TaxID=1965070 RepID=A0A3S3QGS8_9ACAR|nr:protein giant-like protein [Dinothrombium tinctorium]